MSRQLAPLDMFNRKNSAVRSVWNALPEPRIGSQSFSNNNSASQDPWESTLPLKSALVNSTGFFKIAMIKRFTVQPPSPPPQKIPETRFFLRLKLLLTCTDTGVQISGGIEGFQHIDSSLRLIDHQYGTVFELTVEYPIPVRQGPVAEARKRSIDGVNKYQTCDVGGKIYTTAREHVSRVEITAIYLEVRSRQNRIQHSEVPVIAVFGPKLGTRWIIQSRFAWSYYGSKIPSVLNVISMQGFLTLNCIIGGQTLASVSLKLDATLGIIIISVLSLIVTFCGYKVMHRYESLAWIPNAISFIVMLGVGGKHLQTYPAVLAPSAAMVLSFATFLFSSISPIFFYTYLGFFLSSICVRMLGAAFVAAAPGIPSYQSGFRNGSNIGGLIAAIFGPTFWEGTSFMTIAPKFAKVPRYVFPIISEAIIPAIVLTEHFVFRRGDFNLYNVEEWNQPRLLPLGLAAVLAFFGAFGIIIPSMSQAWYTGSIAKAGTGDIGAFTGFLVATGLYLVFRTMERKHSR
ncbi:hypothetical protein BD779DRAFT_1469777 [Infundibulicybe gibba]|nr:hypothetical protein BD779DRAFT_1469777 [Infundibulicybe gibba]